MDAPRVPRLGPPPGDGRAGGCACGRRRDFRFLLGWGPAAERSWRFQIGARAAPPPGPSPPDRAGRRGRSGLAFLARWVLPVRASSSSPPLPAGPALRGRAGRQPLCGAGGPAAAPCPGSRERRRKAWVGGWLRAGREPS